MIESDLSITYFQQTWMMLYNKTKALSAMNGYYSGVVEFLTE